MSSNAVLLGMLDIMTSGLLYLQTVLPLLFIYIYIYIYIYISENEGNYTGMLAKTACCRQVGSSLLCISEVSISHLCPETHYPEEGSMWRSSILPDECLYSILN